MRGLCVLALVNGDADGKLPRARPVSQQDPQRLLPTGKRQESAGLAMLDSVLGQVSSTAMLGVRTTLRSMMKNATTATFAASPQTARGPNAPTRNPALA